MFRRIMRLAFRSVYSLIFFITLILSVSVWMFSPYLGNENFRPFDGVMGRAIFIGVIWFFALMTMLIIYLNRRGKNKKLESDIVEAAAPESGPESEAVKAEMAEMKDKLKTALAALRKSKTGRKTLYELPWYVIIGPPGAGKTTAIVNSGLQFPLADEFGKTAIGGVGGTRNCDWWFTENAVMIDTAGRYTTQESDQESDNAGWLGFLALLKRNRNRQPINGAIIAISLSDLSMQDDLTQKGHARAIRKRLHELRDKLGVRFPVYVLFTKADLVAGFTEYFEDLGKEDREQVWGFTLPLDTAKGESSPVAAFDTEFTALLTQLNAQSLEKMQSETDHHRRSLIAGFPSQFASLRGVAQSFLAEVFQDNRFEQRHMLRGVYFTSGTQEGTPIDRLMMNMARTFGIGRQAIGSGRGTGRSFFLTRLFEQVVFPEAGLVSADDKVERRYKWSRRIAIAATVVFALTMGAFWARSYLGNQTLLAEVSTGLATFEGEATKIPGNPVGDTDLVAVVPALNQLRDLPVNPIPAQVDETRPDPLDPPARMTWGLYQGTSLSNEAGQTYRAGLNQYLLPRLLLRLEEQLQGNMQNPELLYAGLKVYLMLGLQGPMDTNLVKQWMAADWEISAYPGDERAPLRTDLMTHLDALLSQPMQEIALNGPLVDQVQGILSETQLAERVYQGIINSASARELPEWRITEAGGPSVSRVFVRSSGKPLTEGIPGIYTYAGFHDVFLNEALGVAERIQNESWVLGPRGEAEQTQGALDALTRDVLDLYYTDYIAQYDGILGDLDIIPLESLSHAVEVTNVLSGPASPIKNILIGVASETRLTEDRTIDTTAVGTELGTDMVEDFRRTLSADSADVFDTLSRAAADVGEPPPPPPGTTVELRFDWLQQLVLSVDEQPSQLDRLIASLVAVYQELNRMAINGGIATTDPNSATALQQFREEASLVQGPLQRWAQQVTTGSSGIAADGTRAGINAAWQAQVLPFCEQAIKGRYPFDRAAAGEVSIQDFAKLFGPEGLINTFFNDNLINLVDTRSRPWAWKVDNGVDLGISPEVLAQFQSAAEIRDAFFPAGPVPAVTFQVTPYSLDPNATIVTLQIDGQNVSLQQGGGQPLPTTVTWPGTVPAAQIGMSPMVEGQENVLVRDGSWGWFRLLDSAEVRATSVPDRKRLVFRVGGRLAMFDLQASSVINPFDLGALSTFVCPSSL